MKFINLRKDNSESPYNTILVKSCGPNFVYNRRDSFAKMIREQGIIFWFRFWLTFCFNPGCPYLKRFHQKWPGLKNYLNIKIHREFLEGSVEDATKYCLDKAILCLKLAGKKPMADRKTPRAVIADLQECTEMAFGASLCEVFCTWLNAEDVTDKSIGYWTLPNHYLYTHFEPGLLEKFLVKQWDDFLLLLFGVNLKEIPWFLKVLYSPSCNINWNDDNATVVLCLNPNFQNMAEYLRIVRDQRLLKLQIADEIPTMDVLCSISNLNVFEETQESVLKQLTLEQEPIRTFTYYLCAYCSNIVDLATFPNYRLCKRCMEENCTEPRYYCNAKCQIEHWFLRHQSEHAEMLHSVDYRYPSTYEKDLVNSFPFYAELDADKLNEPLMINELIQPFGYDEASLDQNKVLLPTEIPSVELDPETLLLASNLNLAISEELVTIPNSNSLQITLIPNSPIRPMLKPEIYSDKTLNPKALLISDLGKPPICTSPKPIQNSLLNSDPEKPPIATSPIPIQNAPKSPNTVPNPICSRPSTPNSTKSITPPPNLNFSEFDYY